MVTIRQFFLPPIIPVLMTTTTLCSFSQVGNQEAILNFSVPMTCQDKNSPSFVTSHLLISQIQHFLSTPTANCRSSDLVLSNWMSSLQPHQTSIHSHTADRVLSLIHKYDVSLLNKAVKYLPTPFCH